MIKKEIPAKNTEAGKASAAPSGEGARVQRENGGPHPIFYRLLLRSGEW
jgi:hypothetical protein